MPLTPYEQFDLKDHFRHEPTEDELAKEVLFLLLKREELELRLSDLEGQIETLSTKQEAISEFKYRVKQFVEDLYV